MEDYILQMQNVTKDFSGVKALKDVTFHVKRGEIHALVGENGAGKSTLMKVLSGVYPNGQYQGKIIVNGKEEKFSRIKDSEKRGIVIIYQELGLVRSMNVCENIFLGNEDLKAGFINWAKQYQRCQQVLSDVGLDVGVKEEVGKLGMGKQQLIEIAKALSKDVKILILDEPTSSLTEKDSKNLLELLKKLRKEGITCIYISHKLEEVMEISDTITVLRDGETIVTKPRKELTKDEMINYMVGRELTEMYPCKDHNPQQTVFEVKNWNAVEVDDSSRYILKNINMHVRKGEILGIAGLMGAGRSELALSIFGSLLAKTTGELYLNGEKLNPIKSARQALDEGICYVSEDRKEYGLVLSSDIRTNMTLSSLNKITNGGVINKKMEEHKVRSGIAELRIKTPSMNQRVENLSGGNQQKVVLMKALLTQPQVLFLDEPTRGIDVGAKQEIYQLMNKLVEQGICIVMISSELPEVLGMCDRVYVMHEGKISGELDFGKEEVTQEIILKYATGGI